MDTVLPSLRLMDENPYKMVREGYDCIAERYLKAGGGTHAAPGLAGQRKRYLRLVMERTTPGARVLDLGCGAGVPVARALSKRFEVTGVDFSARQIKLARQNVPDAEFVQADMTEVDFELGGFAAIVAFWSIIHVPREAQPGLFHKMSRWLKPGGLLVASMGVKSREADIEDDWLGAPMFWSHFDPPENRRMVVQAGFDVETDVIETIDDGIDGAETFQWIVAARSV